MIDWKDLLKRYIAHIGNIEGWTFLGRSAKGVFSDDELELLRELDEGTNERNTRDCVSE